MARTYITSQGDDASCVCQNRTKATEELDIAFQVVEDVHKPLFAVSAITKQGHSVVFAEVDSHILLKRRGQIANEARTRDVQD